MDSQRYHTLTYALQPPPSTSTTPHYSSIPTNLSYPSAAQHQQHAPAPEDEDEDEDDVEAVNKELGHDEQDQHASSPATPAHEKSRYGRPWYALDLKTSF